MFSIDTPDALNTTVPHHAGFLAGKSENMWILPLVGYMGLGLGFAFLTLAIGMLYLQLGDVRVLKYIQLPVFITSLSLLKNILSWPRSSSRG